MGRWCGLEPSDKAAGAPVLSLPPQLLSGPGTTWLGATFCTQQPLHTPYLLWNGMDARLLPPTLSRGHTHRPLQRSAATAGLISPPTPTLP